MNAAALDVVKSPGWISRAAQIYERQTGQPMLAWILVAVCNFMFQAILYWDLHRDALSAGEFGILNSALGIIGLLTVPLLAVHQACRLHTSRPQIAGTDGGELRSETVTVIETCGWMWGGLCFFLILLPLPWSNLPRFPLELFALMNVLVALGSVVSRSVCEDTNQIRLWTILLVGAAVARIFIGAGLAAFEPWADSGLVAFLVAGFFTLGPALRARAVDLPARLEAFRAIFHRDFLLFTAATLSVLSGIYLFINADRIVAQTWIQHADSSAVILGMDVHGIDLDHYQAAGLLARAILWGTQPLLWILFAQRSVRARTTAGSLRFFWIYLGALVAGALALDSLTQSSLGMFSWATAPYGPSLAMVMIPLGLLQGLGIFSLASRRYPECFSLGGCSLVYALVLGLAGRQPRLMIAYMFGGALVSLMVILLVGIIRWGRRQP
jgi:hypothetical protein